MTLLRFLGDRLRRRNNHGVEIEMLKLFLMQGNGEKEGKKGIEKEDLKEGCCCSQRDVSSMPKGQTWKRMSVGHVEIFLGHRPFF